MRTDSQSDRMDCTIQSNDLLLPHYENPHVPSGLSYVRLKGGPCTLSLSLKTIRWVTTAKTERVTADMAL